MGRTSGRKEDWKTRWEEGCRGGKESLSLTNPHPFSHLYYEVAYHSPIVKSHTGTKSVKNSCHSYFHSPLTVIRIPTGNRKGDEWREGEETEKEVRGDGKA